MALGFSAQGVSGFVIGAMATRLTNIFPLFVVVYDFFIVLAKLGPGDCTILLAARNVPDSYPRHHVWPFGSPG